MTIYERIRDTIEQYPSISDEGVARAVLRDLGVAQKATVELLPLVAAAVAGARRNDTRTAERAVFDQLPSPAAIRKQSTRKIIGDPVDIVALRAQLVDHGFKVGDRRVSWLDAKVVDHQERIEYLGRKVSGLGHTIRVHEQAVAAIEAAGVACLRDIQVAA